MINNKSFPYYLSRFLTDYLNGERGASQNTISSYEILLNCY